VDLTPEQGACLASFEVLIKNVEGGDGEQDTIHKFKVWDKVRALEMLAKHFKLVTDHVEVEGSWDALAARLASARSQG
jgi:hypothetical protein